MQNDLVQIIPSNLSSGIYVRDISTVFVHAHKKPGYSDKPGNALQKIIFFPRQPTSI